MKEYIEREAALKSVCYDCSTNENNPFCGIACADYERIKSIPAADVPSALWTDEPISGTEFMTHNQGQSGFEIHFRTDDKAKYEAVQDECRRQIDHAKPAADVRPVVRGKWEYISFLTVKCSNCQETFHELEEDNFCPNCGAMMEES